MLAAHRVLERAAIATSLDGTASVVVRLHPGDSPFCDIVASRPDGRRTVASLTLPEPATDPTELGVALGAKVVALLRQELGGGHLPQRGRRPRPMVSEPPR